MVAAETGDLSLVKLLVSHGADVTASDKSGLQAWHHAMRKNHQILADFFEALGGKP